MSNAGMAHGYISVEDSDRYLAKDFVCWLQEAISNWALRSDLREKHGLYFSAVSVWDHKRVLEASFGVGSPLDIGSHSGIMIRVPMKHPRDTDEGLALVERVAASLLGYLKSQPPQ